MVIQAARSSASVSIGGAWLYSLLAALVLLAPAVVQAESVRVRLAAGVDRVEVHDGAGGRYSVRAVKGALSVDGKRVGERYRLPIRHGPYRVAVPGRSAARVRGGLVFVLRPRGLDVINHVDLEEYVAGVVGSEMYSSWAPAALRAQAVACRSFVLYQMRERRAEHFDVAADVSSQRYLGVEGESASAWDAVFATRGEVLQTAAGPALAAFHSASGGRTASAAEVWGKPVAYLQSVEVESEDASPDTYWRVAVAQQDLRQALLGLGIEIGEIAAAEVSRRSPSGRAAEVRFRGPAGRAKVTGRQIRQALGSSTLRSTLFDVRVAEGEIVFVGSGYGHGVGMSQWAAQGMALEGASYVDILNKFYPGTRLAPYLETAQGQVGREGRGTRRATAARRAEGEIRRPGVGANRP